MRTPSRGHQGPKTREKTAKIAPFSIQTHFLKPHRKINFSTCFSSLSLFSAHGPYRGHQGPKMKKNRLIPRAGLSQKSPENPSFAIPPPLGVRSTKMQNAKKLRHFGKNFWGGRISSPKVPLRPGNRVFPFLTRARNLPAAQNGPQTQ